MTRLDAEAAISEAAKDALKRMIDVLRMAGEGGPARSAQGCDEIAATEERARKIVAEKFK